MPRCQRAPSSANRILIRRKLLDGEQRSYAVPPLPSLSIKSACVDRQNNLTSTWSGCGENILLTPPRRVLSAPLYMPQYRLRLLCIRSHACSDPKIIGLWPETTLSPGRPLGLGKKVKAFVFQFSWERECTGPFRTLHYNLMRATAKSISLCQNR